MGRGMRLPVIEAYGLVKSYGSTVALRGLNLVINEGEIYGLLGPNGAGKTTTLKILVSLLKPDRGHVRIMGIDLHRYRVEALRNVGYVPEDPYIFPNLVVREFLEFIGRLRGIPRDILKERIERYLSIFDLQEKERDLIKTLSRGMLQKLAVISAFLPRPRVLIMDEPMSNMDPEAQHVFKEEVRKLVRNGSTALISSHMLDMVERFCTRVGIINKGVLIAEGEVDELKRRALGGEDATLEEVFLAVVRGG
ncbi:MAG: ABC transporter ATP-binding protein [Candidatus Baldrarchaeia archaeon]